MIKVADFGLTEDMYGTNYFRRRKSVMGSEEKVPIRWMAPESIENDIYNESTDVVRITIPHNCQVSTCTHNNVSTQWAFGVTVWELFTCGRVPYSGIPVRNVLKTLKAGQTLEKPENTTCSNEMLVIARIFIATLIASCFALIAMT